MKMLTIKLKILDAGRNQLLLISLLFLLVPTLSLPPPLIFFCLSFSKHGVLVNEDSLKDSNSPNDASATNLSKSLFHHNVNQTASYYFATTTMMMMMMAIVWKRIAILAFLESITFSFSKTIIWLLFIECWM